MPPAPSVDKGFDRMMNNKYMEPVIKKFILQMGDEWHIVTSWKGMG